MRGPESLPALRVVAAAEALDDFVPVEGQPVLRLAADDLLVIGAASVQVAGEHIVVDEAGFVGWWLTPDEVTTNVLPHVDWPLPAERPALAQGLIAGVPAKLWLAEDRALLLCAAAYAHELEERL
ncbi:MAG: hypothetical protein ABI864_06270 [Chloroflexota bacterium]